MLPVAVPTTKIRLYPDFRSCKCNVLGFLIELLSQDRSFKLLLARFVFGLLTFIKLILAIFPKVNIYELQFSILCGLTFILAEVVNYLAGVDQCAIGLIISLIINTISALISTIHLIISCVARLFNDPNGTNSSQIVDNSVSTNHISKWWGRHHQKTVMDSTPQLSYPGKGLLPETSPACNFFPNPANGPSKNPLNPYTIVYIE